MKINVGLLGLVAAQSGDDQFEDNSYDYDISSDRWSSENQYSLDEANAGITFGVMARVTKQQDAKHFQKALKLSCWNSNMIRDMNNDNKFSVYFNDQVEYKRFHPGISGATTPTAVGGTVDTAAGRDDLSWLYAVGDLRTGYNHQYGFEHSDSDPYGAADANRLGVGTGSGATDSRNNNRLRQLDEKEWTQSYTAGAAGVGNSGTKTRIADTKGIRVDDENHSVRPDQKWSHRKWGYQSDNVERAQSGGYADGTVVYHFGHHDNTDNEANRPNMRFAANSDAIADEEDTSGTPHSINEINMVKHEFDFHGFKDDWRYSLRMGGCLYEAARWVYDESSFHRTGRLTYTDDTLFMDDPFNPRDGTDIFGAHQYGAHATSTLNAGSTAGTNELTDLGNDAVFGSNAWSNAGSTNVASTAYQHGDCNGNSCESMNVATPSSGGVFADVHWVHVFNAHIFPLQDVGYYQYDQTLGIGNVNENNDSITSRDGYGYNIYTAPDNGQYIVMRDVWGQAREPNYVDTANNAPPGQSSSLTIDADEFHSQYGTINIGNTGDGTNGHTGYVAADHRPNGNTDNTDFYPILTKTRRKIEDFNVVMANPTYEGHGFLNFVATYHDHTENFNDTKDSSTNASGFWIRQVGKRFLSTIGGLTTASNAQRLVCRAVKDGIDSYRMNGLMPANIGSNHADAANPGYVGERPIGTTTGLGHDDPFLAPLGPGPAGNYGNGQRCGAAMYENFGDWFLRPAQTYSAYNKFDVVSTSGAADTVGWSDTDCTAIGDTLCLGGMESYNYWAFILSEGYHPIQGTTDDPSVHGTTAQEYMSAHELWRNGSLHYDRRGSSGAIANVGQSKSSGRGFAISSFPHNELGKDFRFNIRTLHNMGNGVAKQYYQISELTATTGNEYTAANTQTTDMNTLRTSNLRTSETVWSYYFYAVDTIKIAFPEFVARVNHCDRHSHRNTSHCMNNLTLNTENGNPDNGGTSDGINKLSAYPGYQDGHPHRRLGFQDIIIDGVTMKKTDNQYDSRNTRTGDDDWHKQYNFARGLRGDDHTRATLHYLDTEFANEDKSLDEANDDTAANKMCGDDHLDFNMNRPIFFYGASADTVGNAGDAGKYQGYADSYQPLKPCASWCALDTYAATVATGFGVDSSKQTLEDTDADTVLDTLVNHASMVGASTSLSQYGGICGRVLRIDGLLQTYDELHNRQYGTIQEIWVQLQYAYQESMDNSERSLSNASIRKVQSPFPNVFFSAPEVVDIRGFCPSSNMKCRGYMSDQHQPYGGSRNHKERVHWNDSLTRFAGQADAFGANQLNASGGQAAGTGVIQSGNDWTMDRDFRGDSKWPWNYHSYQATSGVKHGGINAGTEYTGRDYDHTQYTAVGAK